MSSSDNKICIQSTLLSKIIFPSYFKKKLLCKLFSAFFCLTTLKKIVLQIISIPTVMHSNIPQDKTKKTYTRRKEICYLNFFKIINKIINFFLEE